jgi:hypothetical protein
MQNKPKYLIFDARFRQDEERAIVLDTAEDLAEAFETAGDYGDAVVVDSTSNKIMEREDY